MMLRARQRWTLATMEKKLRVSEPKLTGMFATFARLTRDEAPGGAEAMSHYHRRRRPFRLWPYVSLSVAAALIGLGATLLSTSSTCGPGGGVTAPAGVTSAAPASCRLPPARGTVPELAGR